MLKIFKKIFKYKKSRVGFTLIETVTAAGVFVTVTALAVNLYIAYSDAQRSAGLRQKIVSEINYTVEKIAQEVRLNEIIYSGTYSFEETQSLYALDDVGISNKEVELALETPKDPETEQIHTIYYLFTSNQTLIGSIPNCWQGTGLYRVDIVGGETYCEKILNITNISISDMGFYISPSDNPYPDSPSDCAGNKSPHTCTFNGYFCTCSVAADCDSGSFVTGTNRCLVPDTQPKVTLSIVIRDQINNKDINIQTTSAGRIYKR